MQHRTTSAIAGIATTAAVLGIATSPATADRADTRATTGDTLYLGAPLMAGTFAPDACVLLCSAGSPANPVAGSSDLVGMDVSGPVLGVGGGTIEVRSEPFVYDGASGRAPSTLRVSYDRRGEGRGGARASTTLDIVPVGIDGRDSGKPVATVAARSLPLDGTRQTVGPVVLPADGLVLGGRYRTVARARVDLPTSSRAAIRVAPARIVALGPEAAPAALRASRPAVRVSGRRVRATVACPTTAIGSCWVEGRLRAGSTRLRSLPVVRDLPPGASRTVVVRLTSSERARVRRANRLVTTVAIRDSAGRRASATRRTVVR